MNNEKENKLKEAALEYARKHSAAPDKETPDWIIADFIAGANWQKEQSRVDVEGLKEEFFGQFGKDSFRGYPLEQCWSIWEFFEPHLSSKQEESKVNVWTFDEILEAAYPTLGRGTDWGDIAERLKKQKST